jgi:opacity protein-like surface antigen
MTFGRAVEKSSAEQSRRTHVADINDGEQNKPTDKDLSSRRVPYNGASTNGGDPMKKLLLAALMLSISSIAHADGGWVSGIGYTQLSEDDEGIDVSLGVFGGSIGYRFGSGDSLSVIPELRFGIGVSDDSAEIIGIQATVEIKSFVAVSVRGEYALNDSVYVFAQPAYANLDLEVTIGSISASDDDWEFGFGAGAGFAVSENASIELVIEDFNGTLAVTGGVRINF